MRLTIAYSKIKKRNLVLINNATYQRETLSEQPIRQPLKHAIYVLGYKLHFHHNWQFYFIQFQIAYHHIFVVNILIYCSSIKTK